MKIGIFKLLINSYLYTYKIIKIFIASLCKIRQYLMLYSNRKEDIVWKDMKRAF